MDEHRHQRRGPIVHVQNLHLRRQSPGQLQRRFAEENKSRSVILVRFPALAVNSRAIKKLFTANQKQLDATGALAFKVTRSVNFISELHINSYATIFLLKRASLFYLAVEWHSHADLVPQRTKRAGQGVHHIHQRARSLQRRALRTNHQDSHSMFDVKSLQGLQPYIGSIDNSLLD